MPVAPEPRRPSAVAFKIAMNHYYVVINRVLRKSVTKHTLYKLPTRWHRLFREFDARYGTDVLGQSAGGRRDLLGAVALAGPKGMLRQLLALARELYPEDGLPPLDTGEKRCTLPTPEARHDPQEAHEAVPAAGPAARP